MSDAQVIEIMRGAFDVAARVAGPLLLSALVIGVVLSVVQTITQIQEATLTFVPKIVAAGVIILVLGNWMMQEVTTWIRALWALIPTIS